MNKKVFLITDFISEEITKNVIKEMEDINNNPDNNPEEPIELYISSFGGDYHYSIAIVNYIKYVSATPVNTIALSQCFSGGLTIFVCGNKRFAYNHSSFLYHEASMCFEAGTERKMHQMEDLIKEKLKIQYELEKIMLDHTKLSKSILDDVKSKNTDWNIELSEALKLGIVDEIID